MIGPLLRDGDGDWTAPYAYTGGGAYTKTRALRRDASALMLFIDFADMVVRDGIDPLARIALSWPSTNTVKVLLRTPPQSASMVKAVREPAEVEHVIGRALTANTSSSPRPRASAPQSAWRGLCSSAEHRVHRGRPHRRGNSNAGRRRISKVGRRRRRSLRIDPGRSPLSTRPMPRPATASQSPANGHSFSPL